MSFKKRLIMSYIIMFIAPIVLTIIAALIIIDLNARNIVNSYGFDKDNNISQIMEKSQLAFDNIKAVTLENPDRLQDKTYIANLEESLTKINTGIVIRKNNNIIYSSRSLKNIDFNKDLPRFRNALYEHYERKSFKKEVNFIRHKDFYFSDKSEGSVFLITKAPPVVGEVQRFGLYMGILILLILIATNGILTYFVSKSVLRPIQTLKDAANYIKEGNLDFEVKPTSNDEIGELCIAFEKMREKLKESIDVQIQYENNRKELISNISHDLKTPVTAIKGYVEGIIDGVADSPEKMDRYIKTIYTKASDLDKLIDELFLFSKLDLNKLPFDFQEINIKTYLEDCVDELSFDLEKNNISLSLKTEVINNPIVLVDIEKLKRVIINIVQNSSKYMDKEKGKIEIILHEEKSELLIEIKDNGQGIDHKDIPYIFDRFYRTDISRNSSTGGSGLGLAIVKRIIEGHEGKIWAESEEGIGTSIFFTLKKQREG